MTKEQKHASELMPNSEAALHILKMRAVALATSEEVLSEKQGVAYVRFILGSNESYGISYEYVNEIIRHAQISKPPGTPNFIAGVINWRGSLITVVDLLKFFHPDHSQQHNMFIIVINVEDITLGILINRIEGSDTYQLDQLGSPLISVNAANPEYILGLHHAITAIIDVKVLVPGLMQDIKKSIYRIGDAHGIN